MHKRKQLPLTIVSEDRSISGNNFAEEINTVFVLVTKHLEPIHGVPLDIHVGDVYADISSEFFVMKWTFTANYPPFLL
mgnify:CR=1 FL=1